MRLEHLEEVAARGAHLDWLAATGSGETHCLGIDTHRGKRRERSRRGAVVDEVRVGEVVEATTVAGGPDGDHTLRVAHTRRWAKQERVRERDDRRRGANADSDREHGDKGE